MKVKNIIDFLKGKDPEANIYIESNEFLLDIYEVTSGKDGNENEFIVLIPESDEE